jgi:hypothetical protein
LRRRVKAVQQGERITACHARRRAVGTPSA